MDYEKKYKEALADMKVIYPNLKGDAKLAVEHAFPELSESEDERIRKAIIGHLKNDVDFVCNGITKDECLAWLEKQKEPHKRLRDKTPWIITAKEELAHDEERLQANLEELRKIRAEKEKQKEQKPAEWSEEDEKMMESIIRVLVKTSTYYSMRSPSTMQATTTNDYQREIDWLKSLRPSWKPSEEQMADLLHIEGELRGLGRNDEAKAIAGLYDDLKKLKGQ